MDFNDKDISKNGNKFKRNKENKEKKTRNLFVKYYFSYVGREAVRDCFWNSGGSGKKKTKYVSGLAFMRHTAGERI